MSRNPGSIEPATLAFEANGTPHSPRFNDVYHSKAGGLAQAEHVFLAGNGLPGRWQKRERFVILETGFGQGLNFLATWAAWKRDPDACERLHFLSVEKHPLVLADLATLHAATPELDDMSAQLRARWPELTSGFHRLEFEGGRVILTLAFGEALALVPQFVAIPDAIFLDGFTPAKNPALWSPQLLNEIGLMSAPGTTLATWSTDIAVREALTTAGFALEKRPGFAYRRKMICGVMPDAIHLPSAPVHPAQSGVDSTILQVAPTSSPPPPSTEKKAIVVGAGLAGSLIAERLCASGWRVELFDRQPAAAMETSSNLTAVMLPMLSLDDNRSSRLNRACYLHALRTVAAWHEAGSDIDGAACGVLQIARDTEHQAKQQAILDRCGFPESYVRWVDQDEASALAGATTAGGGWWFGGGAWWNPPALCRAALARAGQRLTTHFSTEIDAIRQTTTGWCVLDAGGRTLAEAPQLILANAHDLLRLPQTAHLPLFRFRGQVTHLPAPASAALKSVVCKEGYVSPSYQGKHCVGASFHRGGEAPLRDSDHQANLERLESMLPGYLRDALPGAAAQSMTGKVGFRPVSPDKLPIVGEMTHPDATPQGRDLSAVQRWHGLHVATGYGARGLVWSLLMAELLACQINGDPLPLESDLAAIVDPARFLLRRKDA